jgi:hypothetical protein
MGFDSMRETSRNREAFEYFVELGAVLSDETFVKISERYRISKRTIEQWSSKFGWIARSDRILEKVHEKHLEKLQTDLVKIKDKQLSEVRQLKAFGLSTIQNAIDSQNNKSSIIPHNAVDVASLMRSVNELIKTESLLLGEPTERNDGSPSIVIISPAGQKTEIDDDPE